MNTKFTKGPWVGFDQKTGKFRSSPWDAVNERVKSTMAVPIKAGRATVALVVMAGWENKEELSANASLIAAAPEMLEALQALMDDDAVLDGRYWDSCCDKARAAIAKAIGEQA